MRQHDFFRVFQLIAQLGKILCGQGLQTKTAFVCFDLRLVFLGVYGDFTLLGKNPQYFLEFFPPNRKSCVLPAPYTGIDGCRNLYLHICRCKTYLAVLIFHQDVRQNR